ncbi:beta-ketoacyl-[acyl-carrier-protein] synthase family protein [Janthinobacterium fluminis]|uniref:Beta-ketoacyl-[acyl-carrier-protein] synthase family protein n=1 Tax=Janthinobacterium fluminis TaxID=2987524 RepID=A0ABT5K1Z1_9BURK|nr:beta-ketoacyl-[acyl-carrier-protein] synthase family protein [Janthinobacterium fluminis]MDC8758944.1 beta-ketoacyl-[acyl-carrier-protein] synthase family protein [Janthinobacterium fluminis]
MKRVVITGIGAVTSIGIGGRDFCNALRAGVSGVSEITSFDTKGFEHFKGCQIHNFEPANWLQHVDPASIGRSSQFAASAAVMAAADAGLSREALAASNCGVCIGTTDGESQIIDQLSEQALQHGFAAIDARLVTQVPCHNIATAVATELGLRHQALVMPTACSAGNYAIGYAYDLISLGEADFMICGGADSICRKTFAGFYRLGTIAPEVCQPFDMHRKGIMTGEGAGILLLETLDSALARGAHIYAEVLGYGLTCDADHMVAPNRDSIARCIRNAHSNAGITPADVDYICAHGTGTVANDVTEAAAIRSVFGADMPPVSSIKSMIGHTMGAASAIASVASAIAIDEGFIPPTINHVEDDPQCGVDCVPNVSRPAPLRIVENHGFAFGGNNAITIYARYES